MYAIKVLLHIQKYGGYAQPMNPLQDGTERPHPAQQGQRSDAQLVRVLRIEAEKRRFDRVLVEPAHVSRTMVAGAGTYKRPPAKIG